MRTGRFSSRPATKSDLQNRLRHIEEEAGKIRERAGESKDAADLAYLVSYLAQIVEKHFREGEN